MQLQMELTQKQTINHQMLQSIQILQMSSTELEHYLEELALENPVIELESRIGQSEDELSYTRQLMLEKASEWLISTDRQNRSFYEDDAETGVEFWRDSRERGTSLDEHLHSQILTGAYTDTQRAILDFLIESLDSHGFLTEDAHSTALLFSVPESVADGMIRELQSLDPPGVGASDLTECLLLQIERMEKNGSLPADIPAERMRRIISSHLDDIGRCHYQKVMRGLHLTKEELDECCQLLRSLSPYPANSFSTREYIHYIVPDAFILTIDNHLEIVMNDSRSPGFHENPYYVSLRETTDDPQVRQYLQEKIRQIRSVQNDIRQRSSTISRVLRVLVSRQEGFFLSGPGRKLPLSLKDIAAELDLHESTVSRAMQDKYLQCRWGIYPLNYFLSQAASSLHDTGETREQIEQKIREIIERENKKKPLSDQAITCLLKEEGTDISRRTVNKYRTEMGIPDRSGRKA